MRAPWSEAAPGAPLSVDAFHAMQLGFLGALDAHDHAGRGGAPLRGDDFDSGSALRVRALSVRELRVGGLDIDARLSRAIGAFVQEAAGAFSGMLDRAGGRVDSLRAGPLQAGSLVLDGALHGATLPIYRGGSALLRTSAVHPPVHDPQRGACVGELRLQVERPVVCVVFAPVGALWASLDGGSSGAPVPLTGGRGSLAVRGGELRLELWASPGAEQAWIELYPHAEEPP